MTSTPQLTPLRYETPTVTLDVMAREAAISRWSEMPIVQVRRFQIQVRSLSAEVPPIDIRGDRDGFLALQQAVQVYLQERLTGNENVTRAHAANAPCLKAEGLTRHVLHLGSLTVSVGDTTTVLLGAVQLADLGDVFEQLDSQVRSLPIALTPSKRRRPWRQWGAIAASAVATVGLTTTLWPTFQSQREAAQTLTEAPLADQQAIPAAPPSPERLESANSPEAMRSPEDEILTETAEATEQSDNAGASLEGAEMGPPLPSEATPKANQPNPSSSMPSSQAASPKPAVDPVPSEPTQADSETPPSSAAAPVAPEPIPSAPAEPAEPTPSTDNAADEASPEADIATIPDQTLAGMAQDAAGASRSSSPPSPSPPAALIGPESSSESVADTPPEEEAMESFALPEASVAAPVERAAAVPNLATLNAEITEQWNPPADLNRTLTYTLTLKNDGTLATIMPADDLADRYRDRAGLPSLGTQIVLPGGPQRIQVVLSPDGFVQVFPIAPE